MNGHRHFHRVNETGAVYYFAVDHTSDSRLRRLERLLAQYAPPPSDGWARRDNTAPSASVIGVAEGRSIDRLRALTNELRTRDATIVDDVDRVIMRLVLDDCHLALRELRTTAGHAAQTLEQCRAGLREIRQHVNRIVKDEDTATPGTDIGLFT